MRRAALVGLAVILFAPRADAQQPPYRAVVTDEAKVWASPTDRMTSADAGTVPRGTAVTVEREETNGWLAITAPYGSVSWVQAQFINDPARDKPTPKLVTVECDDEITLAAGKVGLAQPLDVRLAKVPNGTILTVIGPKVTIDQKSWYPIMPPAGDVRYVPKAAVQFEKVASNSFSVRVSDTPAPPLPQSAIPASLGSGSAAAGSGPATTPVPAGGAGPGKLTVNHPLWAQAEAAEQENRLADAKKAYSELALQMQGPGGDRDIVNLCYTRMHAIRDREQRATVGASALPSKDERGVRVGAPQSLPAAGTTSAGTSAAANTATNVRTDAAGGGDRADWIGPGTLRTTPLTLDPLNRQTYALETSPGVVKVYVLAGPGVDLTQYIGKRVSVYGVPKDRKGLSKQVVLATDAQTQGQ